MGQNQSTSALIMKDFITAGRIEALMEHVEGDDFLLIQLDLKNDSLFNLVNIVLPDLDLFSGPASYHRIMSLNHLKKINFGFLLCLVWLKLTYNPWSTLDEKFFGNSRHFSQKGINWVSAQRSSLF